MKTAKEKEMAKVGTQRAAELTGRSKSTIQRAMKNGKVSYDIDKNGRRVVDVAELERAFGLVPQENEKKGNAAIEAELENAKQMLEIERLKMRIKFLEEQLDVSQDQIEDLKGQREQWQKQAQQVLLTSQYSQKQAEEYKAELKERERRARARRQQEVERRMQAMKSRNQNRQEKAQPEEVKQQDPKTLVDIHGLWQKIRGQEEKEKATA